MSFLKNMLFGGTGIAAANNAHLAELTLPKLNLDQKKKIIENLLEVMRIGATHHTDDDLHRMYREAPRVVQLNFLAFTMLYCDIPPAIDGEQWQIVRNPFATAVDDIDLKTNAGHFRRKYGITIAIKNVPTNPIDEMDFSDGNTDTNIENLLQLDPSEVVDAALYAIAENEIETNTMNQQIWFEAVVSVDTGDIESAKERYKLLRVLDAKSK